MTTEETIAYLKQRTFHLSVHTEKMDPWSATCFCVARLSPSNRVIVATAAHAVEFSGATKIDWEFRRFDENSTCVGELRFSTNHLEESKRPYRVYKNADVAFIVLPPLDYESHGELVSPTLRPAAVLEETQRITAGTRVGWMGFPLTVENFLGTPQLCYYEGVVSAFHAKGSRGLYLVDGHNSHGVSGGPVFHWRQADNHPEMSYD